MYPTREQAVKEILEVGRRMYDKNYVASNDGNISCKISENVLLATPTGVSKGFMTADMLVEMNLDGTVIRKGDLNPSSEMKMHLRVYNENPRVKAVVHAHPLMATTFAIAGISLDEPILTETLMSLGSVPVARYATPGTNEVPDSIAPFVNKYNAVLLANHGALTWGDSLMQAYYRLESVEYYANITMNTVYTLGRANRLSQDKMGALMQTREKLGISTGGVPAFVEKSTNDKDVLPREGIIK